MAKPKKDEEKPLIELDQKDVDGVCKDYNKDEFWFTEDRNIFFTEDDARAYTEAHFGDLSYQNFKKTIVQIDWF